MIRFINRTDELETLQKDWDTNSFGFVVVYGRRRIGKTRLIEHFLSSKDGFGYTAGDASAMIHLREFKNAIANYFSDTFLLNQDITDWHALFLYLKKTLPKDKKMYIWIDEFSYIVKNNPEFTSVLQQFIDSFLRQTKIVMFVSGSLFGLMTEKVLSHSSPLYGRRTRDLLLERFAFAHLHQFARFSFLDQLSLEMTIGGIPEYLQVASNYETYNKFLQTEFFAKNGYFYREVFFLLSQEFKEIRVYFSILQAISNGNTRPNAIAQFVGIDGREIYPYLELLRNYGFIRRETSILGNTKAGIYKIADTYVDFWFNFVYKYKEEIERNTFSLQTSSLSTYFGKRFELFIKDNFTSFFSQFSTIGSWWHKDTEIDLVALNDESKEIMFGECKWQDNVDAQAVLDQLREKASHVDWNNSNRTESFVIFAKSFKKKIRNCILIDLSVIEKAMKRN